MFKNLKYQIEFYSDISYYEHVKNLKYKKTLISLDILMLSHESKEHENCLMKWSCQDLINNTIQ